MKRTRIWKKAVVGALLSLACVIALAQGMGLGQGGGGRNGRGFGGGGSLRPTVEWKLPVGFEKDSITFVRLWVPGGGRNRSGGYGGGSDFPGAENNLSYRLQQLTSMQVNPHPEQMELTDPRLIEYPFVFMNDPRYLNLNDAEIKSLRKYLLNGGFLMVDDFWGPYMMDNFKRQMQKVLPGKPPQSLPFDHEIFRFIYPVAVKPQVPSDDSAIRNRYEGGALRTWEDEFSNQTPQPADYVAWHDDKGRIVVLVCHNTDLSDGWEREDGWRNADDGYWFFTTYSQPLAYPMAINIFFYALTH